MRADRRVLGLDHCSSFAMRSLVEILGVVPLIDLRAESRITVRGTLLFGVMLYLREAADDDGAGCGAEYSFCSFAFFCWRYFFID